MMQIMPNTGHLSDDRLDRLRADALAEYPNGLKLNLVEYIKALELMIVNQTYNRKKKSIEKMWQGWTEGS